MDTPLPRTSCACVGWKTKHRRRWWDTRGKELDADVARETTQNVDIRGPTFVHLAPEIQVAEKLQELVTAIQQHVETLTVLTQELVQRRTWDYFVDACVSKDRELINEGVTAYI